MAATEGSGGWYSATIGRAGADVTKVEIELPDGTKIGAGLRDSWWPGRDQDAGS